ncbi:hypothetical protein F5Y05DRAFT_7049 [Hypoxylon sp. FL0543]|nr:hypothetical protein F5Y05DRAFT_7049 [Hypoxylon sp. FL0543]
MHYTNSPMFKTPYPSSSSQKWDPEVVLELANEDSTYPSVTCKGWATSRNRRCQRVPAQHKITCARGILNRLARKSASKAAGSPELRDAAELLLCWQHESQLAGLLKQWRTELEDWDEDQKDDDLPSVTSNKPLDDKTRVKKEEAEDLSAEQLRKMMKQMQENLDRLDAELRRRGGNHTERDSKQEEDERRSREEERRRQEEEKKRKQEAEEKRRQEEQRRKEEEEKRKEEAREKAYKERVRAFREKVRLEKEARDREAQRKLEKEAAEWSAAWKHYSNTWDKCGNVSVASMPWPVKSGLQSDVNEANVRLFFAKAAPEESVNSPDKRFKFISAENKRWHTDKVMQRFGPDAVNGDAKVVLGIIAKVLIELRQDARKGRKVE